MEMICEENHIYNMDCLEFMRQQPDKAFDFAFLDPPYNVQKRYDNYSDNLSEGQYDVWMTLIFHQLERISKKGFAVLAGTKHILQFWEKIPNAKLVIIRKGAIAVPVGNYYRQFRGLLVTATPVRRVYDLWADVQFPGDGYFFREERFPNPGLTSLSLTERALKEFTQESDLVFDPFMGCGTTAVAAKKLGRRWAGTEISPFYCGIAEKRLAEIDGIQLDLAI